MRNNPVPRYQNHLPVHKHERRNKANESAWTKRKKPKKTTSERAAARSATADRRYIVSEQKLRRILLEMANSERGVPFSVTEFCNRGDFERRTFYRHYSSVAQLISRQAAAHEDTIKMLVAELLNNKLSLEVNLHKILFFINKHSDDYSTSLAHANFLFLRTFAESMKPLVFREWGATESGASDAASLSAKSRDSRLNGRSIETTCSAEDLDKKYLKFSFEVIAELVWWIQSENTTKSKILDLVDTIMAILHRYSNS